MYVYTTYNIKLDAGCICILQHPRIELVDVLLVNWGPSAAARFRIPLAACSDCKSELGTVGSEVINYPKYETARTTHVNRSTKL